MGEAAAKPSPEPTLKALSRLAVTSAVIIGDTVDDIRSGLAAGIRALGVPAPAVQDPAAMATVFLEHGATQVLSVGLVELEALTW